MYQTAIVRKPGKRFAEGITTANFGKPDLEKALAQHRAYVEALERCGLEVIVLEADERYPDVCFVEDTAIVTETCAIITNPGDSRRRGEEEAIAGVLAGYKKIVSITAPGTVDGGDILRVRDHFYIGRSQRTNREGAAQLAAILDQQGYTASEIPVQHVLHLKTGVTYLGKNLFVATDEFAKRFGVGNVIRVGEEDAYAANCLRINGTVLMPAGFPKVKEQIAGLGDPVFEIAMSEFRKMDGGLTCLSLVF